MRWLRIILLLIFLPQLLLAGNWDEVFDQANGSYKDGNWAQAIELYQSMIESGVQDGKVYFNLGNSYYKSGDHSRAILNYERAHLLMPNDEDVEHNLEIANLLVVDKIEATPEFFLLSWWKSLANKSGVNTWSYLFLIMLWLGVFCLLGYVFARKSALKRTTFFAGFASLLFALGFILLALTRHQFNNQHEYAIMMAPSVSVKSAPVNSGTDLFILHEGLKVKVTDEEADWYQIELTDGKEGWVTTESLERI